jgi:hypothetical protein
MLIVNNLAICRGYSTIRDLPAYLHEASGNAPYRRKKGKGKVVPVL